jgi:hypothetical protein
MRSAMGLARRRLHVAAVLVDSVSALMRASPPPAPSISSHWATVDRHPSATHRPHRALGTIRVKLSRREAPCFWCFLVAMRLAFGSNSG